jgi:hypothetical protein
MSPEGRVTPRTFYLNEQHELARSEKAGGGGIPKYIDINWATKGTAISHSLNRAKKQIEVSPDPSKENHYFLLAAPVEKLAKASEDRIKAVGGKVFKNTDFAREDSRVFRRLGVDLLRVADDGSAVVHMKPEIIEQLSNRAEALPRLGAREQSRWATIDRFAMIPSELRIDSDWLQTIGGKKVTDAVVEFQPLLTRAEIDALVRVLVSILLQSLGEAITGIGTDFSGRQWIRGKITRGSLTRIAKDFFSVQSLHSPLVSLAAGGSPTKLKGPAAGAVEVDASKLPVIAVVDTGVPTEHTILAKYRRGRGYTAPTSALVPSNDHGCFVSSRLVFGNPDYSAGPPSRTPPGSAVFYDVNVSGIGPGDIDDKSVVNPALQAVVSTAPDIRIFNLSFDTERPLDLISAVKRSAYLDLVQDLDNFIFQNDVVVVVAAGNSTPGLAPSIEYPHHFTDPQWGLGAWSRSFNALTCGSFVGLLISGGLVKQARWPSPFCRVGPGLCNSPKPDFSVNGGNVSATYQKGAGLGVWGLASNGMWEDRHGTSFAAPLLAREAAFAMQRLQLVCEQGAQPFAVTVKAFLALTAVPPVNDKAVAELAERTLGRGLATAQRLDAPSAETGVMIWQGVLEDEKDIARIQVPIPSDWLKEAVEPYLKLIVTWDPPTNAVASHLWATRSVSAKLRMYPEAPALRSHTLRSYGSYPLLERLFDLRKLPSGHTADGDFWLIEITYNQIADYLPAMIFPPQQRVAFAAELFDKGPKTVSPQSSLQALPATKTMIRLTVPPSAARMPVVLKTPL